MNQKMFSLYDTKAQAFMTPFFQVNTATAVRAFSIAVNDPNNSIYHTPEDYILFHVGTFDDNDGKVTPAMESICNGLSCRNREV